MNNTINPQPYLRTSREYPEELHQLSVEVNKSYVEIARAVNSRTISLFPVTRPAQNGENWYLLMNQRQQGFRQVYTFGSITTTLSIPHGINVPGTGGFTKIYGTFTDGIIWYPLPYVDFLSAANQVTVIVDPVNIFITAGAGSPPSIVSGRVILEWISLGDTNV